MNHNKLEANLNQGLRAEDEIAQYGEYHAYNNDKLAKIVETTQAHEGVSLAFKPIVN